MTQIVGGYASNKVPLHVAVMDMEWHEMLQPPACESFGGVKVWGGYSWNRTTFPDPAGFIKQLQRGNSNDGSSQPTGASVKVALNYHADGGIDACQDADNRLMFAELAGFVVSNQCLVSICADVRLIVLQASSPGNFLPMRQIFPVCRQEWHRVSRLKPKRKQSTIRRGLFPIDDPDGVG